MSTFAMKIGVRQSMGWCLYRGEKDSILISAPFDSAAEYPEGGFNMTISKMIGEDARPWAEMEHVGPLTDVAPGESVWLEQVLSIIETSRVSAATPDEVVTVVEEGLLPQAGQR